jgi:hypothetical protein
VWAPGFGGQQSGQHQHLQLVCTVDPRHSSSSLAAVLIVCSNLSALLVKHANSVAPWVANAQCQACQLPILGLELVCCKPAPCVSGVDGTAYEYSGVCSCMCSAWQCSCQSGCRPAADGSRGQCQSPNCNHQQVQGEMYEVTYFFPDIEGSYSLPQLVAPAASPAPAAVPEPVSESRDGWQGSAWSFS